MASTPPNQAGSCSRLRISFQLRFCLRGTLRFAFRCRTDDVALAQAASTASVYVSMTGQPGRDRPSALCACALSPRNVGND